MSIWVMIAISVVMVWGTVWICNASVEFGNAVNIVGGLSKIAVLLALMIGGFLYISNHGAATELTLSSMMPRFDDGFLYAPTLVYLIVGAETVACMGSALRNPERNVPLGLFIALAIILVLYSLSIGSMMVALPAENLSLVGGITQSFDVLFGEGGRSLTIVMSLIAIVALVTYIVPWLMAASRAAVEAAENGEMPAIFAKKNAAGSPSGANNLAGVVATAALVLYGFMSGSADDLFWGLFAFASFLLFVTYFFLLAAFIGMRKKFQDAPRPFKVAGGMGFAWLIVLTQGLVLIVSCVVFVFPDIFAGVIDLAYSMPTIVGIIGAVVLIEVSIFRLLGGKKGEQPAE